MANLNDYLTGKILVPSLLLGSCLGSREYILSYIEYGPSQAALDGISIAIVAGVASVAVGGLVKKLSDRKG